MPSGDHHSYCQNGFHFSSSKNWREEYSLEISQSFCTSHGRHSVLMSRRWRDDRTMDSSTKRWSNFREDTRLFSRRISALATIIFCENAPQGDGLIQVNWEFFTKWIRWATTAHDEFPLQLRIVLRYRTCTLAKKLLFESKYESVVLSFSVFHFRYPGRSPAILIWHVGKQRELSRLRRS